MLRKFGFIFLLLGLFNSLFALDLSEVSKNALKEHKLILLSVESQNCFYCKKMNKEVFTPKKNISKIEKQYIQKIVIAENIQLPSNLKAKYYPTNYILDPKDMSVIEEFVGYMKADDFISLLEVVYEEESN